jgi:hypothetical protein
MTTAGVALDQRKKNEKKKKKRKADMTTVAVARDQRKIKKKKGKSKHDHYGSREGVLGQWVSACPLLYSSVSFALLLPAILRFRPTRPRNHCALPVLCTSSIV